MKKILDLFGGNLLDKVSNTVKKFVTTKGDKMNHEKLMTELNAEIEKEIRNFELEYEKVHAQDRANARLENSKVQESENASWLAKNTGFIIDLTMIGLLLGIVSAIFKYAIPEQNSEVAYMILGLVIGYVGNIITYHRGSSSGSKDKTNGLMNLVKKK